MIPGVREVALTVYSSEETEYGVKQKTVIHSCKAARVDFSIGI